MVEANTILPVDDAAPANSASMRRFFRLVGVLTILLAAAWIAWALVAHHRLQLQLDAIAAEHEPILDSDFALPDVPAGRDAAPFWLQAVSAIANCYIYNPQNSGGYPWDPTPQVLSPQWIEMERKAIAVQWPDLNACDAASALPECSPLQLNNAWYSDSLARALCDAAVLAHADGDDVTSLQRCYDCLKLANAISHARAISGLDGMNWANDERSDICGILCLIAADLRIDGRTRGLVGEIQAQLRSLDQNAEVLNAIYRERARIRTELMTDAHGLLGPMSELNLSRDLQELQKDVTAARADNAIAAQSSYNASSSNARSAYGLQQSSILRFTNGENVRYCLLPNAFSYQDVGQLIACTWRTRAVARLASAALACRLYRADHADQLPRSLSELVPDDLPQVPLDPLDARHLPIGFVVQKEPGATGDRPVLCVGIQPTANAPLPKESLYPLRAYWPTPGLWCDLRKPAAPSSSK